MSQNPHNQEQPGQAPEARAEAGTESAATGQRWDRATWRALAKGLLLLVTLAAMAWALKAAGIAEALDTHWADVNLKHNNLGWLLFLGLASLYTSVGLPRQLISFLGGYAFGFLPGALLALAATLIGCCVAFTYARFLGRDIVRRKLGKRLERINQALKRSPFTMTLIIRFLPFGSNIVTNLVAGVSVIPAAWFLLGSAAGFAPQTLIFALLGDGIRVDPLLSTLMSGALLAASILLGILLYRKYKLQEVMSTEE